MLALVNVVVFIVMKGIMSYLGPVVGQIAVDQIKQLFGSGSESEEKTEKPTEQGFNLESLIGNIGSIFMGGERENSREKAKRQPAFSE